MKSEEELKKEKKFIKEFIGHYCETCKKEIFPGPEWETCFNKNHTIRTSGQAVVNANLPNQGDRVMRGIALTHAKPGDEILVKLE